MALPTAATDAPSVLVNLNYAVSQVSSYISGQAALTAMTTSPTAYGINTPSNPNTYPITDSTSIGQIEAILETQLTAYNAGYVTLVQELITYAQAVLATLQA